MKETAKKRVINYIKLSVLFTFSNIMFDYFFRQSNMDLSRSISIGVGVSYVANIFFWIFSPLCLVAKRIS
jgi:hypothetical protein